MNGKTRKENDSEHTMTRECERQEEHRAGRAGTHQEGVSAKGLDADEAAEVDKMDALQVVQRQLVIEELCKLHNVVLTHLCPETTCVAPLENVTRTTPSILR